MISNDEAFTFLSKKINYQVIDDDVDVQEKYFKILDKIIDAAVLIRYDDYNQKTFSSIDQIDNLVLVNFYNIDQDIASKNFVLNNLANTLTLATKKNTEKSYYYDKLEALYDLYIKNSHVLKYQDTTDFYNEILNKQEDSFVSRQKELIKDKLTYELPLTKKAHNKIVNNMKLKQATLKLQNNDYAALDMDLMEIREKLNKLHLYLNTVKPFNKEGKKLDQKEFEKMDYLFLHGNLTNETLKENYPEFSPKEIKIILNKYHKILLSYTNNIVIDEKSLKNIDVPFNYNYLQIVSEKYTKHKLEKFIFCSPEREINYIYDNFDKIKDLFQLLPLIDVVDEFNIFQINNVILNFNRINDTMIEKYGINLNESFDFTLNHLYEIFKLANIYNSADLHITNILGEENVAKIIKYNRNLISRNPTDYTYVYDAMLGSYKSHIPPIKGEFKKYHYECCNNYDLNKIMIGLNRSNSCIGPNGAGREAYIECLTEKDADVMIITNKETGEFYARSIMFRRGNFIIMAPIYGRDGHADDLYNEEFLSTIGQQFLDKALEKGDNLDYVFITNRTDFNRIVKSDKFPKIVDESFFVNLPHCDLSFAVNAIGYNDFENDIDPDLEVFTTYKKERKKIQISEENYKKDMLRIKALSIFDKEEYAKEKYKEEFDLIMKNDYKIIITGQDWYVALRSDNKIERTLLFTTDDRQNMEFNSAFRFVLNEYKNSNDDEIGLKRISK